jgi:hypothetical protein
MTMLLSNAASSALLAPTPADGARLALQLVDELAHAWDSAIPANADPAEYLKHAESRRPDASTLLAMQYSLVAAANNYWRK